MLSPLALPLASPWFLPLAALAAVWLGAATLRQAAAGGGVAASARIPSALAAVAAAAVPVLLYWRVTQSWWLHDDPSILRQVIEYPVLANFYDPLVWRAYSPANFTPMLPLSFWLDLEAFGLRPGYFYLHQLAALGAAAGLGYFWLRRFLWPLLAFLVVALVALSPSAAELAQSLMTRHYVEGLVLLLLAFAAFSRGQVTGRRLWAWLAAGCYLAAALAKEVYAPAILVFPFLLAQDRHRRHWWSLLPIGTAALAYTLWRLRMLGAANLVSGYGDLHGADSVGDAAQSALAMGAQLGLDHWSRLLPVALLCLLALLLLAKRGDRWSVGLLMASLVAVCAPLMPLFPNIASRSLLLPTIWVYAVAAFGLQLLAQAVRTSLRPAVVLLLSGFVVLTLCSAAAAAGWQRPADSARARAEWAFMMHADSAATLVRPLGKPWYYVNVGWLRRHLGDGLEGPSLCYEPCLCARSPDKAYSAFSEGAVTRYKPDLRACPELVEAAVQVQLHYDAANGVLYWDLAPQRDGRWSYARVPVFDLAPIPRKGQTPYQLKRPTRLQFFFESSEGWTTASGVLTLDPRDVGADRSLRVGWSRGGPSSKD